MSAIINYFLTLPQPLLHHWGYWIILLSAFLEASPFFGIIVPGQTIVILGGFFAREGVFDIGDIIWIAALGAILGDLAGYYLGSKYGVSFINKYGKYFFLKKENFEKSQILLQEHAGKTLLIGRFHSLTRALTPFAAGASKVKFTKFLFYNIIGGVAWAATFGLIGYIFGQSYEVASKYVGRALIITLALTILLTYGYNFINKKKHIFAKYHLKALLLNIASIYLFSKMIEDIFDNESIAKIDLWVNLHIQSLWNPGLNKIMIAITTIGSAPVIILLTLLLLFVLIKKKKWHNALLLFFATAGGAFLELLFKFIIHRARPENSLIPETGFSFPSGHATLSIIFFSLFLYSFIGEIKNAYLKKLFALANILVFVLIGFSRIYLNVHWFSDVVGGFSLGMFLITFLILLFKLINSLAEKTINLLKVKLENLFSNGVTHDPRE